MLLLKNDGGIFSVFYCNQVTFDLYPIFKILANVFNDCYSFMYIMDNNEKIGQDQFHSFVFGDQVSWQEIIHDLINTEQLDPWDIDLYILAQKYLEKIKQIEEADFVLSSKVLLIASIMLKLKSELLVNKFIKDLDDVLFNHKEKEVQQFLKIEDFDEDIPELYPRTPLPRFKKISLQELMMALNKAVKTEERRETKKITEREAYERTKFFMPKQSMSITDKIKIIHSKITELFRKNEVIRFSEFSGPKKEDKINTFVPLLHLDNHNKLWLQQEKHFDEIWIHKDGSKFIQKDEIITSGIEEQFENSLDDEKWESIDDNLSL